MMDDKPDQFLENLLRKARLKSPSPHFTEKVIQQIETDVTHSTALDLHLKEVFQRYSLKAPSATFTDQIIAQTVPPKPYQAPIIPLKLWVAVAAVIVLMVSVGVVFSEKVVDVNTPFQRLYEPLVSLPHYILAIPASYVLGLGALSALLSIDYVLRYKLLKFV